MLDELVYSGAGSGCRDDDEDACVLPDAGSGDDLITPVYVPSTRRPPSRVYKVCIQMTNLAEGLKARVTSYPLQPSRAFNRVMWKWTSTQRD